MPRARRVGALPSFEEPKVILFVDLYIFYQPFFFPAVGVRMVSSWLVCCFPSCDTGNMEKRKCEDSQAEVAMATSQSSKHVFILFIYLSSFFFFSSGNSLCHTRDRLSRFRLGNISMLKQLLSSKIGNKWVFSFHSVLFESSHCFHWHLQISSVMYQKGPLWSVFFLLWLFL